MWRLLDARLSISPQRAQWTQMQKITTAARRQSAAKPQPKSKSILAANEREWHEWH
jgi:hypothetical protein